MILRLFTEFFKVGLFSVGGGMATIPFLTELSQKTGWFSLEELANMVAVGESTPGPIGVNIATYVGYKLLGVPGGIITTIGLVLPSWLIILIVSSILEKFKSSNTVKDAFNTIRPASSALITSALYSLAAMSFFAADKTLDYRMIALAAVVFIMTNYIPKVKKLHPIVFILLCAVAGVVFGF